MESEFSQVIDQGVALQDRLAGHGLVAVGDTAAALHAGHRYSLDVDCVTSDLRANYDEFVAKLEDWPGWQTNRRNPPVLILGERAGVELGVRQLRRQIPLCVTTLQRLVVPTLDEILRVKAFLLSERRSVRDYVDFAALARKAGEVPTLAGLGYLNLLYPVTGSQTAVTRFAEACAADPVDLAAVSLWEYKGLQPPFDDWAFVRDTCREVGQQLLRQELTDRLSKELDAGFMGGRR